MPAPERRTRADVVAAAVLVAVVVLAAATLWWTSDARHTTLITDPSPVVDGQIPVAEQLPGTLAELWRAPSPATPAPVVHEGTVATGAAGEVTGRDLGSGSVRWSYRRDLPLCTVGTAFDQVVTIYRRDETCSEVTTLHWADGGRGPQRSGPVAAPTRLTADGDHAAVTGRDYLEVWRTDLVRTLAYGRLPTPAQPDTQPRPDCTHGSLALDAERLALVEHCPDERVARLTVQRSNPKESDRPEVRFSTLLPGEQARVVALSSDRVAAALPDPSRLVVFDANGIVVAEHPLAVPDTDLRGDPPGGLAAVTQTPTGLYWFTGSTIVALDITELDSTESDSAAPTTADPTTADPTTAEPGTGGPGAGAPDPGELRPRWMWSGAIGPGSVVAGRLLVPTPGALAVLDVTTGQQIGTLPVDRGDYAGPVSIASSGDVILEQRGDTLVALR